MDEGQQKNIVLLSLFSGNGGITSWSRKFITTFYSEDISIIPIDRRVQGRAFEETALRQRFWAGIAELRHIVKKLRATLAEHDVAVLHTTTSGDVGTFRDYVVAKMWRKRGIRTILHLHYGCATEDLRRPLFGRFLLHTMCLYDHVWVLDRRTEATLTRCPALQGKVFLTPNSITVAKGLAIAPKTYHHVAFIGNLVPEKGLYELVRAVVQTAHPVTLSIVGNGSQDTINTIKDIAGSHYGSRVQLLGRLPNDEALAFMHTVDIVALPTYYPWEAFPISILEAMSLGKLVIATRRAAIGDMLTALDGTPCGCFVREHSVEDITNAIEWAIVHRCEADTLCKKAYEKVCHSYSTEVIYKLYGDLYKQLLN